MTTVNEANHAVAGNPVKRTSYSVTLDYALVYLYDRRNVSAEEDDIPALVETALSGDGIARGWALPSRQSLS